MKDIIKTKSLTKYIKNKAIKSISDILKIHLISENSFNFIISFMNFEFIITFFISLFSSVSFLI